jgi:hypothetical protein
MTGPGAFACTCIAGYVQNGEHCEEEDACGTQPCHMNGVCYKTGPGKYQCQCKMGFHGDGFKNCDVDKTDEDKLAVLQQEHEVELKHLEDSLDLYDLKESDSPDKEQEKRLNGVTNRVDALEQTSEQLIKNSVTQKDILQGLASRTKIK